MGLNYNAMAIVVTCAAYFWLTVPTIYIVILCAQQNYSLFIWHPTCLTLGCGLLMAEAIYAISGDALLGPRVSRAGRVKIHWILHAIGLVLIAIGFGAIIANKIQSNSSHFGSTHAIFGLIAVIVTLLVALGGVLTLFSGLLQQRISLGSMKLVHGCLGVIAIILLFVALLTGIYKGWWPGSSMGRKLTLMSYIVGLGHVLLKPAHATLLRIRGLFN